MGLIAIPIVFRDSIFGEGKEIAYKIGFAVIVPIMYGLLGFIGGFIGSLIYNFCSGIIGGIRVDID